MKRMKSSFCDYTSRIERPWYWRGSLSQRSSLPSAMVLLRAYIRAVPAVIATAIAPLFMVMGSKHVLSVLNIIVNIFGELLWHSRIRWFCRCRYYHVLPVLELFPTVALRQPRCRNGIGVPIYALALNEGETVK